MRGQPVGDDLLRARTQSILDTAVDGIITIDERGIVDSFNPAAEKIFGYSADEMFGKNISMLMPEPDRAQHDGYISNYIRTGDKKIIGIGRELLGIHKDGTLVPIDLAVSEVHLNGKRSFTGIVRDLTERKRADEKYRRLAAIVENSDDAIISMTLDGEVLTWNRGAEQSFGYSAAEMIGQSIERLAQDGHEGLQPGLLDRLTGGEQHEQFETVWLSKEGRQIDVSLNVSPVCDDAGVPTGTSTIARDITARKQLESALRESEERLGFMVEHLPTGAAYIHVSEQTIMFNKAVTEITGFAPEEITTLDEWFSTLYGNRAREVRAMYQADRDQGFPSTRTVQLDTKSGTRKLVEFAAYCYDHREVWLLNDVTELKETQQQLVQSERLAAIGQMMTGLAHESRNALQRTRACLDMLELDNEDDVGTIDLIHRGQNALDELHRLYEEVRGYAAPIKLEPARCDLLHLWETAWSNLSEQRRGRSIDFESPQNTADVSCRLDPHRLGQVLRNLLENSIAAVPDPGKIELQCADAVIDGRAAVRFVIRDNGPGFDEVQLERVFEPFFTTKTKGTGLGMAIAKRIVEAHGGIIQVGNSSSGGAEIAITLPRDVSQ